MKTHRQFPSRGKKLCACCRSTILFCWRILFNFPICLLWCVINDHSRLWKDKRVLCVATMGLFSGDGADCSARLLKKHGAKIVGGLHICMPDSVCDVKLLKKTLRKIGGSSGQRIERLKNVLMESGKANTQRTAYISTTE